MRCQAFVIAGLLLTPPLAASTSSLGQSASSSGSYSTSGFNICGSGTRSFRVSYNYGSSLSGFGANHYRMTARLFKNGNQIGSSTFQGSSSWSNQFFYNLGVSPGTYTATVQFENRRLFGGWTTVETVSTNSIVVTTTATPDFDVNGTPIPADGSPLGVCAGIIRINAAATNCETNYWIGVHETDRWWNRTYQYEWGTWFSGQAPNNISLQQLSTNSASYWMYGPASRQGSTLIGGYLNPPTNTTERYYTVEVCTGEPSWQCKVALIKVDGSC